MSDSENIFIDSMKPNVTTISHHIMMDLLRVTLLVYNYGDSFQVKDNDENIETFVSSLKAKGEFDKIKMDETRKHVLEEIALNVPSGKIYKFINKDINYNELDNNVELVELKSVKNIKSFNDNNNNDNNNQVTIEIINNKELIKYNNEDTINYNNVEYLN